MSTKVNTLLGKEEIFRHVLIMKVINKIGALSSVTSLLAKHGVNITGVLAYVEEFEPEGFMIMLVDKVNDAIIKDLESNEHVTYINHLSIPLDTKFRPIVILLNSFNKTITELINQFSEHIVAPFLYRLGFAHGQTLYKQLFSNLQLSFELKFKKFLDILIALNLIKRYVLAKFSYTLIHLIIESTVDYCSKILRKCYFTRGIIQGFLTEMFNCEIEVFHENIKERIYEILLKPRNSESK